MYRWILIATLWADFDWRCLTTFSGHLHHKTQQQRDWFVFLCVQVSSDHLITIKHILALMFYWGTFFICCII